MDRSFGAAASLQGWCAVVRAYAQAMRQQVSEGGLRFPAVVFFSDEVRYTVVDRTNNLAVIDYSGNEETPSVVE